ncbi:hypothetical protein K661_02959, partial [Piscirickettsia salmonis LF-89 = ATCC VR-1361]
SQLRSAKNPNLPRPTHPVLSTPWLAAPEKYSPPSKTCLINSTIKLFQRVKPHWDYNQKNVYTCKAATT